MQNDEVETCFFCIEGKCTAIVRRKCTGFKEKCTFYITERDYIKKNDDAIRLCREKGLCNECKYRPFPCKTSKYD